MTEKGDYTLKGLRGQELRDQTIGIIGTGRIGMESLKIFSSFTKDILLYDPYPREDAKAWESMFLWMRSTKSQHS